jgi:hypothetical protein
MVHPVFGNTASIRVGEMRNAYRISIGRSERKIPLGRVWSRWEWYVKTDPKGMLYKCVEWIYLAQDRILWRIVCKLVMYLTVP